MVTETKLVAALRKSTDELEDWIEWAAMNTATSATELKRQRAIVKRNRALIGDDQEGKQ